MPYRTKTNRAQRQQLRQLPIGDEKLADLTMAARVWVICETLGERADKEHVVAAAKQLGVRERTARNHFNTWRYARTQARRAQSMPISARRRLVALAS